MNIKFKNVHSVRYRALAFVLSLIVLLSGLVWYGVAQSNQKAEAAGSKSLVDDGNTFLVDATLYDYFYDAGNSGTYSVGAGGAQAEDNGNQYIGEKHDPYTFFNGEVSKWWNSGENDRTLKTPLYFGNFYDSSGVTYNSFEKMANGSVSAAPETITLGLLKEGVTTEQMDALPYFNHDFLERGTGISTTVPVQAIINTVTLHSDGKDFNFSDFPSGSTFYWGQTVRLTHYQEDTKNKVSLAVSGVENSTASRMSIYYQDNVWEIQPEYVVIHYTVGGSARTLNITPSSGGSKNWSGSNYITSRTGFYTTSGRQYGETYSGLKFPFRKVNEGEDVYWEFNGADMPTSIQDGQLAYKYTNSNGTYTNTNRSMYPVYDYVANKGRVKPGFFPFDNGASASADSVKLKDIDYGFGAKIDIDFNLPENRKTVSGNDIEFEFRGDDDVWIFVDDSLVLDLGGDHGEATGRINFTKKEIQYLTPTQSYSNSSTVTKLNANLQKVLADPAKSMHTITIYYMERGMFESNLYMKFNMVPVSNVLKVAEQTNFDNVNYGLRAATKKIADDDVFGYGMINDLNGQSATSVQSHGVSDYVYPTYDYFNRVNTDAGDKKTVLTGKNYSTSSTVLTDRLYLNTNNQAPYTSGADYTLYVVNGNKSGAFIKFQNDDSVPGRMSIKWSELGTATTFCLTERTTSNDFAYQYKTPNESNDFSVSSYNRTSCNTIVINTSNRWKTSTGVTRATVTSKSQKPSTFDEANRSVLVKQQTFKLRDPFAKLDTTKNSVATDDLVLKTDDNGNLFLMYNQSAEFSGLFSAGSIMKVGAADNLYSPNGTNSDGTIQYTENPARKLSSYYTTTVGVYDEIGREYIVPAGTTLTDYSANNYGFTPSENNRTNNGAYKFNCVDRDLAENSDHVEVTQTFTNTVNTGSVTIEKQLKNGEKSGDEFTMRVTMTDLFGVSGTDVTDYSDLVISGSTVNRDGEFKMKAGDTVKIDGIPVGTVVTISEQDPGNYFDRANVAIKGNTTTGITLGENRAVTVTNTRKTGELVLSKGLIGSSGATVPLTDYDKEFTFTVELTSNDGETIDFSKYPLKKNGELLTPTYSKTTIDNDTATFDVQVSKNNSVTISGIPYGTTYTVTEAESPGWKQTAVQCGQSGHEGSTNTDVFEYDRGRVIITNQKQVGTLTINKELSGSGISGYEDRYFPVKILFYTDSSINLDDFDITYKVDSGSSQKLTIIEERNAHVAWVKVKPDEPVVVEGIPVGIRYDVLEEDVSEDYGKEVPDLAGLKAGNWISEVTSDNTSHTFSKGRDKVTFEGNEVITVTNEPNVGTLKISKQITNPQSGDEDISFDAVVTLALPDGYDPKVHEFTVTGKSGGVKLQNPNGQKGTIQITFSVKDPCEIGNVPIGTIWEITESQKTGWECEKVEYLTTTNQLNLDKGVMPTAQELPPSYNTFWNQQSAGTFNPLVYNGSNTQRTTNDREIMVTNRRVDVAAYLTIEKYIDELYYGKDDNAHHFADGSSGVTDPLNGDKTNDPFGYLNYTSAEQDFVFKIEASKAGEDTKISYVVLKFGANSAISGPYGPGQKSDPVDSNGSFYYKESTTVKVQPGWTYKVTELRDENGLAWRYEYNSHGLTVPNGEEYEFVPKNSSNEPSCSITITADQSKGIPSVRFFNVRSDKSQTIESDMSSIKNTLTIK